MTNFIQAYLDLLIYQYYNKPNAQAEISAILDSFNNIFDLYNSFETEFDLDVAKGKQLDIIGRIVGLSRTVPLLIPKKYFGFDDDTNTFPFDELFSDIVTYPFKEVDEQEYTDGQLNDTDYRFFLYAKIAKNFANSDIVSINEIVAYLFNDLAEVVDNYNMSLDLYIDATIDVDLVRAVQQLNLLPKPQGVRYNNIIFQYFEGETFGFSDDPSALGFDELFATVEAGKFAEVLFS